MSRTIWALSSVGSVKLAENGKLFKCILWTFYDSKLMWQARRMDGWTSVPDSVTVKCEKNGQNWPKIDEANEEHNKWHTYKYVLYLPVCVCVCVGCALHLPILWPLHKLTKGSAWRVTTGDTFLLLLLRPSCLSFARTNKIKLNCLKIAKNEAKCQRGPPIRRRRTAQKPKWLWTSRTQWESGCLWGLGGGGGVTAQVACFFCRPISKPEQPKQTLATCAH